MPKLVILDGNSLLYRGFFAMRYLSTADGTPTNAVFTFVNMLLYVLENERPDCIFAAFDPPGPTFRHEAMAEYKANRKEMPDDLKPQRRLARDAAEAFRAPVVEIDGFEADDVVGTLAEIAKQEGYEVVIVTGDGDALQLVDDDNGPVTVMMTVKGVTDTVIYDEAAVRNRYGLTPAQIPDFKGLKGDSSDNIPGVPGIGEKGASKLLGQYGSVENLIAHAVDLPERTKNSLVENQALALHCKDMATIRRNVPLPDWLGLSATYQQTGPDFPALRELFQKLEFKMLIRRLVDIQAAHRKRTGEAEPEPEPAPPPVRPSGARMMLATEADVDALIARLTAHDGPAAVHLHTEPRRAGHMDADPVGIAFALPEGAWYAPWGLASSAVQAYLEDPMLPKAVYDSKHIAGVLRRHGITVDGVAFDALLAAYIINPGRGAYPLETLATDQARLDLVDDPDDIPGTIMDEAMAVQAIRGPMSARIDADGLRSVFDDVELPLAPVLAVVEQEGVRIDSEQLKVVSVQMERQMGELEAEIYGLAGGPFSIGSTKQLQEVLFEKLKLPAGRKTKTGYSTGQEVLEDLASQGHEIAGKVLAWRELSKLKSTYADSLPSMVRPSTGRIHTTLSQTTSSTGRLSSHNPNLQNIPIRTEVGREIRRTFIPSPGNVLVSADYSQIELRVFAHMTHDPQLVEAFAAGDDIHARTARTIFGLADGEPVTGDQRRSAKTINFAVLYGAGAFRVSGELGIPQAQASELIKAYHASYPSVKAFMQQTLDAARETGFVQTLLGRRRYVPDLLSANFQFRQAAEREAGNMPIQGTAADIMKIAMIRVADRMREEGFEARMLLQVHDELLFDCPPAEVVKLAALVRGEMESAYQLSVALVAEVKSGANWWEVTPVSELEAPELANV